MGSSAFRPTPAGVLYRTHASPRRGRGVHARAVSASRDRGVVPRRARVVVVVVVARVGVHGAGRIARAVSVGISGARARARRRLASASASAPPRGVRRAR